VKASQEGFTKHKNHWRIFYRNTKVFKEPKGIPPERDMEHEIKLFPDSPFSNIGLYR
jgi:hypothetical protein